MKIVAKCSAIFCLSYKYEYEEVYDPIPLKVNFTFVYTNINYNKYVKKTRRLKSKVTSSVKPKTKTLFNTDALYGIQATKKQHESKLSL